MRRTMRRFKISGDRYRFTLGGRPVADAKPDGAGAWLWKLDGRGWNTAYKAPTLKDCIKQIEITAHRASYDARTRTRLKLRNRFY